MLKQQIINQVKEIILKYSNPERIYLYGSYANGEAKDGSDIDIAYDDPECKDHYKIVEDADKIDTLIKIDIKNIAKTEKRFKNRVKSIGKVIFSATKKLRADDGLHNFSNAFTKFEEIINSRQELLDEGFESIYLDAVIKRFEFTYEMSWKALKRYLDYLGIEAKSPRQVFKEAYTHGILDNEDIWLDMIEQRNMTSHVYDESEIKEILEKTDNYKDAFFKLKSSLENELNTD